MSPKAKTKEFIATGRRKTSTALVRITEGKGAFTINNRDLSDYRGPNKRKMATSPLTTVGNNSVDASVNAQVEEVADKPVRFVLSSGSWKMGRRITRSSQERRSYATRSQKIERKKTGQPVGTEKIPILKEINPQENFS